MRIGSVYSKQMRQAVIKHMATYEMKNTTAFGLETKESLKTPNRLYVNFTPLKDPRFLIFTYIMVLCIVTIWYGLGRIVGFAIERL